jgi:hypothetical protein
VPRVGGREAVDEGVEEVRGGGRVVGEAAGGEEERVELGRLAHGAGGRPWRRGHGMGTWWRRTDGCFASGSFGLAAWNEAVIRPK